MFSHPVYKVGVTEETGLYQIMFILILSLTVQNLKNIAIHCLDKSIIVVYVRN